MATPGIILKVKSHANEQAKDDRQKRVFILGASGTIGQATTRALIRGGHEVTCFLRKKSALNSSNKPDPAAKPFKGANVRFGEATDYETLRDSGFGNNHFDVVVSCIASRDGSARSAWAVDYQANLNALKIAKGAGVKHFILLSAICVQNPRLEFQFAKLAFEKELMKSGIAYTIVRPTAYFKSLSGQVDRVKRGKPFLLFGDGRLTSCKPISDADLGDYIVSCLNDMSCHNRILPIGGPGPAITPKEQGECLFRLMGKAPKFKHIPVSLFDISIWVLSKTGRMIPKLADKAEFARIGKYYATESMLVINSQTNRYDAEATPSTGKETLFDFYENLLHGSASVDLGDHRMF